MIRVNVPAFAALERLTVDLAVEIDGHAIRFLRCTLNRGEDGALPAHALDHRVESCSVISAPGRSIGDVVRRLHLDLGQHLENGGVFKVVLRGHRQRLDARTRRRLQLLLVDGLGEGAAHQVADDLGAHLLAKLLANHREGRLAGTEALQAGGARDLLEPLLDFCGDFARRHGDFHPPFQTAGGGQRYLHDESSIDPRHRKQRI